MMLFNFLHIMLIDASRHCRLCQDFSLSDYKIILILMKITGIDKITKKLGVSDTFFRRSMCLFLKSV